MVQSDLLIASAIIAAALAVRLWNLGGKSFWLDEAFTWQFSSRSFMGMVTETSKANPALYFIIQHYWNLLFGTSEWAMRFLSVIFGMTAVALTGWIGNMIGGRKLAFISMALAALSPMPVIYSQMARHYSFFLSASLVSYGSLIFWERENRHRWAVLYILSTVISAYTHNYWVFNFFAQQVYMLRAIIKDRSKLRPWAVISTAALIGCLTWLLVLTRQYAGMRQYGFWIPPTGYRYLLNTMRGMVAWDGRLTWLIWPYFLLAVPGLIKVTGRGGRGILGIRPKPYSGLLLLWWLCPILIPFFISRFSAPVFWDRYTIAAAPAFYFLIGRGLLSLPRPKMRWAVAAMMVLVASVSLYLYYPWQMEDWRGAAGYLEESARPGDVIILSPPFYKPSMNYYYRGAVPYVTLHPDTSRNKSDALRKLVRRAKKGRGRIWLLSHRARRNPPSELHNKLLEDFEGSQTVQELYFGQFVVITSFDFPRRKQ